MFVILPKHCSSSSTPRHFLTLMSTYLLYPYEFITNVEMPLIQMFVITYNGT